MWFINSDLFSTFSKHAHSGYCLKINWGGPNDKRYEMYRCFGVCACHVHQRKSKTVPQWWAA